MHRGLAVFDLDGTLLRGATVCEVLAEPLGKLETMRMFESRTYPSEIVECRLKMARWYEEVPREKLLDSLANATWAPGAVEGVQRLLNQNMTVAIASVTWDFAVKWFAERIGVSRFLGTVLDGGSISHVFPADKGDWVRGLAATLDLEPGVIAAIGDSSGDWPMLAVAGLRVFVGKVAPPMELGCIHMPGADISDVADMILERWSH